MRKVYSYMNIDKNTGKILEFLYESSNYVSSEEIAEELNISSRTVIRCIKKLRKYVNIISKQGKGGGYMIE